MGKRAFKKLFAYGSELGRGLGGAFGVNGGWLPLPTRLQRYCDPASLVDLRAVSASLPLPTRPRLRGNVYGLVSIEIKMK